MSNRGLRTWSWAHLMWAKQPSQWRSEAAEQRFLTFSIFCSFCYCIKEYAPQPDQNERPLHSKKDLEMFIDIALLHLSLLLNFKVGIAVFALMRANLIALDWKIYKSVQSCYNLKWYRWEKEYCYGNYCRAQR